MHSIACILSMEYAYKLLMFNNPLSLDLCIRIWAQWCSKLNGHIFEQLWHWGFVWGLVR
jgi:hypothetical protein